MQLATENSDTKTACELEPSPSASTCRQEPGQLFSVRVSVRVRVELRVRVRSKAS